LGFLNEFITGIGAAPPPSAESMQVSKKTSSIFKVLMISLIYESYLHSLAGSVGSSLKVQKY